MNHGTKLYIMSFIFTLIVCFTSFSTAVYAGDNTELAGDIIQILIPVTAGGMTIYKADREGLVQFSKSFLTTLGVTYALKYSIDAERPDGGSHSFPSGHTSAAFSGASFLQKRYGLTYGIPAYAAASFVGWSRIDADKHYFRDVLAGAAIGVVSTYLFTDVYQEKVVVTPVVGDGVYGMVLQARF